MSEQLGEALLVLRTDDRGLDTGIANARGKSEGLGRTLDATSGSASRLGKALDDTGTSASNTGTKTAEYSREVTRLKAQIDPAWGALQKFRDEAALARQALDAGAISHKQYVEVMRQSATSAGLLTNAGKQVVAITGAQRAGMQQLTMNLGDMSTMYALGARPMQIFASQSSQVIQAIQLMSGGTSKFAAFMGGGWGLAIIAGAQILLPLIGNLIGAEDATKKAGDANETLAQKLDRSKHSLVEVIAALRDYNGEQAKARETTLQQAEAASKSADKSLKDALATREKLKARLQALSDTNPGDPLDAQTRGASERYRSQIAENDKQIASLQQQAREAGANLADQLAQIDADPTKKIREGFAQLRTEARATITDVDKLHARLADLYKQEDAALKKARESRTKDTTAADASIGDMTALLEKLFPGARITSTTGGKHVAGSDHYAGRAIDFVPAGGAKQYSTAEVEKILEDAGVTIRRNAGGTKQIFGPDRTASTPGDHADHFHVAWTGGASPEEAARRKAQQAEREARAQEKEAQRVERYSRDLAGLQQAAADIQKRMADTAEERYQLELHGLEIATAEQKRRIEANKDYTEAEKAKLLAALAIKDSLERDLLAKRKQEELDRQALEIAQAQRANTRDLLQSQARLTTTRTKRRDIELQLLDLSYEEERAALEAARKSSDPVEAKRAEDRLKILPELKAGDRAAVLKDSASPLERYRDELQGLGDDINDELGKVAVNGLKTLSDGLVDVIMNAKSLGDVFKGVAKQIIAELIQIAVQQAIILPLMKALGIGGSAAGGGSGGGGGGGIGGFFGSIFGSLFGGMHADGGLIPSGTFGIVGERGPEPVFATSGGIGVLPNSALRTAGSGSGGGAGRPGILHVSVSGARGNAEIEEMVRSGVSQGIASYDRVVGDRVQDHLARRS